MKVPSQPQSSSGAGNQQSVGALDPRAIALDLTQSTARPYPTSRQSGPSGAAPAIPAQPSRRDAIFEVLTSLTGVGLFGFMLMHLTLLSSVLLGPKTMNTLAGFLEDNYLLQIGAVFLIPMLLAHIALTARKAPVTARRQQGLFRQMQWLRHEDTWTWVFQVVSGILLIALVAVHLTVILFDLPIQAAKSGARVFGDYLWFYLPFILLVEGHGSLGIYRVAVKWGPLARHKTHLALTIWSVFVIILGLSVLLTFYAIGRGL